jgi:cell division protein ZapA (FtsZ GTPase activity inhibitor)
MTQKLTIQQVKAKRREAGLVARAQDVKTLLQWFSHDVLALAGPDLAERQELFDFIEIELKQRAGKQYPTIRKLRKALHNQRDQLLAFAGVVDQKLAEIAEDFELPLLAVRDVCLLHRKQKTSNAYWERWNQLHSQLSEKFYEVMEAVGEALKHTPRASSMVENLNSRLRNYFFLRRSLGDSYLSILQFFLNHRRFLRSRVSERVGKSPTELLTGQPHPHWLELLGFKRFQRV